MPSLETECLPERRHFARAARLFVARAIVYREAAKLDAEMLRTRIPGAFVNRHTRAEFLADMTFARGKMRANAIHAVANAKRCLCPMRLVWARKEP